MNRSFFKITTNLQNQLMWIIFFSLLGPTVIFGSSLYFLSDKIACSHGKNVPQTELLINNIIIFILIIFPVFMIISLYLSFKITNKIVGPIERVTRELDNRIQEKTNNPIIVRKKDSLELLVHKINILLKNQKND